MPIPTTRTVTGHINSAIGTPAAGSVHFISPVWLRSPGTDTAIPTFDIEAVLDGSGNFTVALPVNDDPAWVPLGWAYRVEIQLSGFEKLYGIMALTSGGTVDLWTLLVPDGAAPDPVTNYVLMALLGVPSGVATLGPDGKLVASQLPAAAGGAPTWDEILNKPLVFPPADHTHPGGVAISTKSAYFNSGNVTPQGSGAFVPVTGGPTITIPALVGDYIEWDLSAQLQLSGSFLDPCVIVGGAAVRFASTGVAAPSNEGDGSMYPQPGTFRTTGTHFRFTVAAEDLSSGNLTIGLATKGNGTGTIFMNGDPWLRMFVKLIRGSTNL